MNSFLSSLFSRCDVVTHDSKDTKIVIGFQFGLCGYIVRCGIYKQK